MYTFVPALAGVFLLAGGWSMFRWAWIPVALLIFMYPLPERPPAVPDRSTADLQHVVATFMLQTLGFDAIRDGNLIRLGQEHVMNVVDACAGLKMLTIFVWLAAVVIAVARPGVVGESRDRHQRDPDRHPGQHAADHDRGDAVRSLARVAEGFHDSTPAAVLMMGVAVGFILLEMKLLSYVIVNDEYTPAMLPAAGGGRAAPGPRAAGKRRDCR